MKALPFSDFSIIPISFINHVSSAACSFVASIHKSRKSKLPSFAKHSFKLPPTGDLLAQNFDLNIFPTMRRRGVARRRTTK